MASSNLHRNPSSSSSFIAVQHLSVSRCLLLISILLCLLMLAHNGHAEPNKQDNKAGEKKTAADAAAPAAVATEEEEVQTCTVRVQVVSGTFFLEKKKP